MTHDNETELPWSTRLWMSLAAPILRLIGRTLLASCRIERVEGKANLAMLLEQKEPMLLCCWHQRLSVCVGYLLRARRRGLQPGFLVSPSRDGELVARVVAGMGATILRGSSTRTGARALRELYGTIRDGVSPVLHPDGPHGPARQVKSGSVMLAQMTRTPILPMAFSADRFWQLGSWDALIIPKPFARVVIVIGEPLTIARGDDIEARAVVLGEQLDALTARADQAMGVTPARQRR
ncbi:lysophospholipid acyltransferase family protein [Salinisphaera aquimarina]|uniref:Lysophospholipid acyltransferase family protein n=1 Tax=Salinisphaera aquimarina TaxID=2094031 RepID=A0ABV7ESS4_9GAMM